jgi:predicted  nucleic acid-binding Zn-ribbon protein
MSEQMGQVAVSSAMSFTRYDLRNADERIAQVRSCIARERAKLRRLRAGSGEATGVRQVLAALERTLRQFQEYRNRIEHELRH